jgi:segregation and condensation protein A
MASTSMTSGQGWLVDPGLELPRRPERHLLAPAGGTAALQRPVTLGELIRQLEEIAERLDAERGPSTASASRPKRYSERDAIDQVCRWPTARNCPETTAALSQFLLRRPQAAGVVRLSKNWWPPGPRPWKRGGAAARDLDCRPGRGVLGAAVSLPPRARWSWSRHGGLFGPLAASSGC